jgi:hypothetical protein
MEEKITINATLVVEKIIKEILSESHVEVKFDEFEKDRWAFVMYNDYDEDKEYSIRFNNNEAFILVVGYYDKNDEYFEGVQPLTEKEVAYIPNGLKKVMKKVMLSEDGLRVPCKLLVV